MSRQHNQHPHSQQQHQQQQHQHQQQQHHHHQNHPQYHQQQRQHHHQHHHHHAQQRHEQQQQQHSTLVFDSSKLYWYIITGIVLTITLTTIVRSTMYLSVFFFRDGDYTTFMPSLPSGGGIMSGDGHDGDARSGSSGLGGDLFIDPADFIYRRNFEEFDAAPIVVEEFKLIFFTMPRVVATTWKTVFRRMKGYEDWYSRDWKKNLPHSPLHNGLTYLSDYTVEEATQMMTDATWTKAIFVREPKQRFLSAFLSKAINEDGNQFVKKCCPETRKCKEKGQTVEGFLELIHNCIDTHWAPQYNRMEPKYWKYINFVGHAESARQDAERLLRIIGAWDEFGQTGYGKFGNLSLFETEDGTEFVTESSWKVWQWFTPAIERKIEAFYSNDYAMPIFNFTITNFTKEFFVDPDDKIYSREDWDGSPIVLQDYKLIFFTTPRIAATPWKQLFRRAMGIETWQEIGGEEIHPHNPWKNGLKYLYHYPIHEAEQMMTDPNWTRAVWTRNPKDRFLSVYLKVAYERDQIIMHCCPLQPECARQASTMVRFLDLMHSCKTANWIPQYHRMDRKYWRYINFFGKLENGAPEAERLLRKVGMWDEFGASGWGPDGTDYFLKPNGHELDKTRTALAHYSPVADKLIEQFYKVDYDCGLFNYTKKAFALEEDAKAAELAL